MSKQPAKKRIKLPINITLHPDVRKTLDTLARDENTSKAEIVSRLIQREKNRRQLK